MTKEDYNNKLEAMLNDGISTGVYAPTEDKTLRDLKFFQDFLRRNFKDKYDKYKEMNQPLMTLENSTQQQKLTNSIR